MTRVKWLLTFYKIFENVPKGGRRGIHIQKWSPFEVCKQEPTNVIAIDDRSIDRSIDLPSRRNRFRGTIKYNRRLDRKISATPRDVFPPPPFFHPFSSLFILLPCFRFIHPPTSVRVAVILRVRWPTSRAKSLKGGNGSFGDSLIFRRAKFYSVAGYSVSPLSFPAVFFILPR